MVLPSSAPGTEMPDTSADEKLLAHIIRRLKRYQKYVDEPFLQKAYTYAKEAHEGQYRKSGEPYFAHPMQVAKILTELKMDYVTVAGGFLHDVVEDTGITLEQVEQEFGHEVSLLVDGVTKIGGLKFDSVEARQAENYRKMILSMVKDIRVIMIKFADRLHNMRTLEHLPQHKRSRIAIETRDVYAPLAHRLGIAKVKWELEDLCLKNLDEQAYWGLVKNVAETREKREAYIQKVTMPIRKELKKANIRAKITGRPKHLHSIYQKIRKQDKPFSEIYDLLAIRIIVKKVEECYFALGLVHSLFTPVQERFKDYIATPKSNMYQSLHTTVIGLNGRMVEVQIRTDEMHRTAEEGIAAHWAYKEGKASSDEMDKHLEWLRQLIEWQQDTSDPQEYMENLRIDLFQDEIFVFSPKGDLYKLPLDSTPVDFAFAVHTDIGLHCFGAKVNGKIEPLSHALRSGDTVEIITSTTRRPNPDWIKFIKTTKARSRIKRWLRDSLFEQSQKLGEEILHKQFKRYHIERDKTQLRELALSYGYEELTQFYAALGRGEISVQGLMKKAAPEKQTQQPDKETLLNRFISRARKQAKGVRVQGVDNLMIDFAKCCQPIPGDKIIGFISRGRGVIVHRTDCRNLSYLISSPERRIEVEWDVERDKHFMVRLSMTAEDRKNFLRDVSETISQTDTNIVSVNMNTEETLVRSQLIIEVKNVKHLQVVMRKLKTVPGMIEILRLNSGAEQPLEP